jgi:serine/threonine-protein kinase
VEPDIWIWDLRRETLTRLTSTPGINVGAVWSADGRTVFFASRLAEGGWEVAGRSADGAGETTVLARQLGPWVPSSVTPDGAGLVASTGTDLVTPDIGWLDIAGKAEPRILLDAEFRLLNGELSPDGRWLAYESYESGQPQIFVRPFPGLDSDRWPVSATGGTRPVWSRDGKEIFYLDGRNFLTAVAIGHRGDTLSISRPEVVIDRAYFVSASQLRPYDVSPDGRRFLMLKAAATDTDLAAGRLVLVQNWFDELRRVAPPRRSATR